MKAPSTKVAALAAAVALLAIAATAAAAPVMSGSGTYAAISATITSTRQAGGNTIIDETVNSSLAGVFTGVNSVAYRIVVHPSGFATFEGKGTYTSVVAGCGPTSISGTFEIE